MVPKPFVVVEAGVEAKEVAGEMAEEVAGVVTTIEVEGVVEDGAILFDCTTPSPISFSTELSKKSQMFHCDPVF